MAKRTSIYLGAPLQELLDAHSARTEEGLRSGSAQISCAVDRYLAVISQNIPDWTSAEWCLACDALIGVWLRDAPDRALRHVQVEISAAVERDGAAVKWGVDWLAFQTKLEKLSYPEALAVTEIVERFWADKSIGHARIGQLVNAVRLRVKFGSV